MELDFIKQLSKETFGYLYIAATRLSQKKYAGYFFHSKKENFFFTSPSFTNRLPSNLCRKKQEILILTNKPKEVQLLWQPKERGCHETLTVIFTAYDSLGLFRKSAKREISFPVTVLPAFCKIQAEKLQRVLEKKQQLNAYQRGLDFREHRAYRPGDSFNRIDWKLSAHTQEWLYREYDYQEEECSPLFCFWGSPSPKFEPLLDLYFSLWHLRKEKQPELLILGNRAFHGKDPGHTYFASLEAGDEKAFFAHLKKYAKNKSSSLFLRILLKSQKLLKHCQKIERFILFIS